MIIDGPAGALEADYHSAAEPRGIQAVLCHPHPLYGGSMRDPVLACLEQALRAHGVGCLTFNFRGVGASTGHFDDGTGEVADLLAAIAWLQTEFPGDALWLGGYSFGSHVVWQALPQVAAVGRVLLIAPPVDAMDFAAPAPGCPVDVFAGTRDPFVGSAALAHWSGVNVHPLEGADHFFHGQQAMLTACIGQVIG